MKSPYSFVATATAGRSRRAAVVTRASLTGVRHEVDAALERAGLERSRWLDERCAWPRLDSAEAAQADLKRRRRDAVGQQERVPVQADDELGSGRTARCLLGDEAAPGAGFATGVHPAATAASRGVVERLRGRVRH